MLPVAAPPCDGGRGRGRSGGDYGSGRSFGSRGPGRGRGPGDRASVHGGSDRGDHRGRDDRSRGRGVVVEAGPTVVEASPAVVEASPAVVVEADPAVIEAGAAAVEAGSHTLILSTLSSGQTGPLPAEHIAATGVKRRQYENLSGWTLRLRPTALRASPYTQHTLAHDVHH